MALDFPDLRALVLSLAKQHHNGAIYPMGPRTGLSPSTIATWANRAVKIPDISSLRALADAYGLELKDVVAVAMRPPAAG